VEIAVQKPNPIWKYAFEPVFEFLALVAETIVGIFTPPYRVKDLFKQLDFVIWQSAPVVIFSVSFAAIVTIIEASFHMKLVIKNDALVPGFAALLILRELGAVVSALLITSRVGAGLAAEVGTMKVTEQIDALRMLGIQPVKFLVVPRFLACVIGGFVLSIIANLVCLYCAMLVSQVSLGYSPGSFIVAMRSFVSFQDLIFAAIKGACFGSVIPLFSCFYGLRCKSGADGVGSATTQSVVTTSVAIIVLDFVLGYIFSYLY
jgi:phospholipid/cholesterol/gamma-HCH transport system permease protein